MDLRLLRDPLRLFLDPLRLFLEPLRDLRRFPPAMLLRRMFWRRVLRRLLRLALRLLRLALRFLRFLRLTAATLTFIMLASISFYTYTLYFFNAPVIQASKYAKSKALSRKA